MGCSGRAKADDIRADQKWDFISLSDFKSTSCLNVFAYAYLLGSLLVSIAVYGVDTFTAVNLLVFDRWSGKIDPAISLSISKWIFSACIIASWVNLGYEYFRALRVIKRGAVAESYLDSLAVRIQCIRWTKSGRGWRRFLVFAELTKSKKGAEYVALFTYFAFQAWIRVIFCQGPRQVVNAVTLKAVFEAKLLPTDGDNVGSALGEFFSKIGALAKEDNQQALILSGMLFTLVIWVFGALSLMLAVLFYILFLWHYIPNRDGGLSGHCELKINKRLAAIVSVKVNKAIEEEERKRRKEDAKAFKKGEQPAFGRQATLPTLFNPKEDTKDGDKMPPMPMLNRNDTVATLPAYTSRPGTPGGPPTTATFELNDLESKRPAPGRSMTNTSFASNAPLISNASDMGWDHSESPAPNLPRDRPGFPAPIRTMTASSQRSQWSAHSGTPSDDRGYTASPMSYENRPLPSNMSMMSSSSYGTLDSQGRPVARPNDRSFTPAGPPPSMGRRTPFEHNSPLDRSLPAPFGSEHGGNGPLPPRGPPSEFGRNSPAPFGNDYDSNGAVPSRGPPPEFGRNSPAPSAMGRTLVSPSNGYQAYNPNNRSASSATPLPYPSSAPGPQQNRNVTDPGRGPPGFDNERPGTAQSNRPPPGRGPPQDYFGDARPGTAQSNRPPPSNVGRGPAQDYFGDARPGTAQSNRPQPNSNPSRNQPQDYFGNGRPGTAQGERLPPPNRGAVANPGPYNANGNRVPAAFDDGRNYAR